MDGIRCAGATFLADDPDESLRTEEHAENLATLDLILPGYAGAYDPASLDGRVGFRPASLPTGCPWWARFPPWLRPTRARPLPAIPRQSGLYALTGFGARGLVWASLMGELLASQLDGNPLPLEQDLVDALDPARYLLKPPPPEHERRRLKALSATL